MSVSSESSVLWSSPWIQGYIVPAAGTLIFHCSTHSSLPCTGETEATKATLNWERMCKQSNEASVWSQLEGLQLQTSPRQHLFWKGPKGVRRGHNRICSFSREMGLLLVSLAWPAVPFPQQREPCSQRDQASVTSTNIHQHKAPSKSGSLWEEIQGHEVDKSRPEENKLFTFYYRQVNLITSPIENSSQINSIPNCS